MIMKLGVHILQTKFDYQGSPPTKLESLCSLHFFSTNVMGGLLR
jgi:hypothetical protein